MTSEHIAAPRQLKNINTLSLRQLSIRLSSGNGSTADNKDDKRKTFI